MTRTTYVSVDLGASSGRVMLGSVGDSSVQLDEVRRFTTRTMRLPDGLHWDVGHLYAEIMAGVAAAVERGTSPRGVAFDSWGVDYALLSEAGSILGTPFHHRDARTAGLASNLDTELLYAETGIQTLEINTLVQLLAERPEGALSAARTLLFMPDLFGYFFTGRQVAERSIASTSQLLGWDGSSSHAAREHAGLPDLLPPVVAPGSLLGSPLRHIRERTGFTGLVLSVAGHDTASAVAAIPAAPGEDFAFISCGTWGLVGLELRRPELGHASHLSGFSNEQGVDGTYRYLRNVTGLWLITESLRFWQEPSDAATSAALVASAAACPPFRSMIDPLDPVFVAPGDIPGRIAAYCESTSQPVPSTKGEFARCILDSLALSFADAVAHGLGAHRDATRHRPHGGWGIQIDLLCATVADLTGIAVVAGPTEATALGNVLVQARALGDLTSLEAIRARVAGSVRLRRHEPQRSAETDAASSRFAGLLARRLECYDSR